MRIVITGRGGTGESTFAAIVARHLCGSLLLIDIDPDQSLADMLGVNLEKEGVRTVQDILFDIQKNLGYQDLGSLPLPYKVEYLFNRECLYESKNFDLVSLGIKWTEGCYCSPNDLLKVIIPKLAKNYANVVIDAPAGLEHLNRKVTSEVDDLFLILDPSLKSIKTIERTRKLVTEIGVRYRNFYLVANHRFTQEQEESIRSAEVPYLGKIEADNQVEEYNLQGKSLLELPDDSPAFYQ